MAPTVAAALAAPAALGAALPDPAGTHAPAIWRCPLLHATGMPCPACGATRAFICLFHGDPAVLHYNWTWLVWWGLACVLAIVLLVRYRRGAALLSTGGGALGGMWRRPLPVIGTALGLVAISWATALANLHWIART